MFVLGLTGSIATGKSTALQNFADAGIPVYSADAAVHELYRDEAVIPVGSAFPGVVVDGAIDRQKLGQLLVEKPERLQELEDIVHPLVGEKMRAFLAQAEQSGADIAVLEIPLLFETGRTYPVDAIAVTACNENEQRRRALARPGMTVEKFQTILARQLPQAEKKKRADFVIDTGHDFDDTARQIDKIIAQCRHTEPPAS